MAGESCNLNKDEAEILKPSSPSLNSSSPPPPSPSPSGLCLQPLQELSAPNTPPENLGNTAVVDLPHKVKPNDAAPPPSRFINRCSSCHKRVGLTGFRCRCGDLFCALHRYSDTHDCSFDYKAAGREQIAKANPFIRAAKVYSVIIYLQENKLHVNHLASLPVAQRKEPAGSELLFSNNTKDAEVFL